MSKLPAKINVIYAADKTINSPASNDDNYYSKTINDIKELTRLKSKFDSYKYQLNQIKDLVLDRELTLANYVRTIDSLIIKLLQRCVLTKNTTNTELNIYGEHTKKINNLVNYANAVQVASLLQYSVSDITSSNFIEDTLKNYYSSLNIDIYKLPADKHSFVITKLALNEIKWSDIKIALVQSLSIAETEQIQKDLLIVEDDFDYLKVKFTLNLISHREYQYYEYLVLNKLIDIDLIELFYSILTFDLIGSTPRFYLALAAESLYSMTVYINNLPQDIKVQLWEDFLNKNEYIEEKTQLANYLNLTIECFYILSRFNLLTELDSYFKLLKKDYLKLTQYSYNYEVNEQYTLSKYYDGI